MNYDRTFFNLIGPNSQRSARATVSEILKLIDPASVVDVGCGVGLWCAEFIQRGVPDVIGIDGGYVSPDMLAIPPSKYLAHDLELPLRLERQFDLAVCLEVAEHVSEQRGAELIEDLTRLAPIVLFSAAIPNQGGTDHINEQWPDYWAELFEAHGFVPFDLRPALWNNTDIAWWYRQNSLLYVREDHLAKVSRCLDFKARRPIMPLVHPALFAEAISRYQRAEKPGVRAALRGIPQAVVSTFNRRFSRT